MAALGATGRNNMRVRTPRRPFLRAGRLGAVAGVVSALALGLLAGPAGAAKLTSDLWYHDGPTDRWRIAGTWSFAPDALAVGDQLHWSRMVPATARAVRIPHVWNADLSEQGFDGAVGWYYARFRAPRPGRYRLRFLSVTDFGTAYVDGVPVGSHEGGFLQWETRPVRLGPGSHLLAVRVDNRQKVELASNGGRGWWNWGGITREVELRKARDIDVRAVRTGTASLSGADALVKISVRVANATTRTTAGRVAISLAGRRVTSPGLALAPGAQRTLTLWTHVPKARTWSPGHPSLYRLDVLTGRRGRMERAWTGMVGIRQMESRDGNLYLNGRRFFAEGAALHDHARNVGAALTPSDLRANLEILRGLHANFTRSHYPLHPGFLEMLDRSGIVIWGEAPVYWLTSEQLGEPGVRSRVLDYVRQTIDAQASHASVGMWSGGNELASEDPLGDGFLGYVKAARDLARSLDPLRPFALAFDNRYPRDYAPFCDLLDVFGINYYLGWYWGPSPGEEHRRELRRDLTTKMSSCPKRPWIMTEFGAEAGFPGDAQTKGSFGYQQAFIDSTLRGLQQMPAIDGASIWAGRDFAVSPGWTGGNTTRPNPPINQKGLVTLSGRRKPAYAMASDWFRRLAAR